MYVIQNKDSKMFIAHSSLEFVKDIKQAEIFVWYSEALDYLEKRNYNKTWSEILEVEIKLK